VFLSLTPFGMNWREKTFISWVGLRGAIPIVLALFPIMAQIPESRLLFNVTCVVVLFSLLLQGTTLAGLARLLKLEIPAPRLPQRRFPLKLPDQSDHEIFLLPMREIKTEPIKAKSLRLPKGSALVAIFRERELVMPSPDLQLQAEDWLAIAGNARLAADIGKLMLSTEKRERLLARQFFGDFTLSGDALLSDLEQVYGITIDAEQRELSLSQVIAARHRGHPVVGDNVTVGLVQLVVMAVEGDRVTRVGMKLPSAEQ
jgi:cell volume regulation protein A